MLRHPLVERDIEAGFRAEGHWTDETLASLIAATTAGSPDRLAVAGTRELTYAELDGAARRLAAFLADRGAGPARPVLAVLAYDWRAVVTAVACSILGAPLVGTSPEQPPERVARVLSRIEPAGVILLDASLLSIWAEIIEAFPGDVVVAGEASGASHLFDVVVEQHDAVDRLHRHGALGSVLLASGGTTGEPKLIVQHDNSLLYSSRGSSAAARISSEDVYLGVGPFGHIMTTFATYIAAVAGCTLVPVPGWRRGTVAADLAEQTGATVSMMTSTHAYDLLCLPEDRTPQLATLSRIMAAGKPDKFFSDLERRYDLRMMRLYGLSEAGTHVIAALDDIAAGESDGLPLPGTDARIVDPDTGAVLPPGATGEYQVRGPSMCLGYVGSEEATSAALTADGFWRTGDLAVFDLSGHVHISGRLKESIRRGGININPEEMEALLFAHPAVLEGCLIGSPDDRLGQQVNAVVVLRTGAEITLPELRDYLQGSGVPRKELPDRLFILASMPRTDLGRLSKRLVAVSIPELAE